MQKKLGVNFVKCATFASLLLLLGCNNSGSSNHSYTDIVPEDNTPNSPVSVLIDNPETLELEPEWKVLNTNKQGESVEVANIESVQFSPLPDKARSAIVLIDKNEEPRMAAIDYQPDNPDVKITLDTTTQFFIAKHPLLVGVSMDNDTFIKLIEQMQQSSLYPQIKEEIALNMNNESICPLSHDCNSYASQLSEELLLGLPLFAEQ